MPFDATTQTDAASVDAPAQVLASSSGEVTRLFRTPGLAPAAAATLLKKAQQKASAAITGIDSEIVSRLSFVISLVSAAGPGTVSRRTPQAMSSLHH